MKNLLRWVGAIALALMPSLALAQSTAPVGRQIYAPAGYLPAQAIYCDDGTGHAALCSFSGGPGGSSVVFSRDPYIAVANGTGFNSGDHLAKVTVTSPTGTSPTTFWVNDTQGTVIGSPALASISQLPLTIVNTTFGATQSGAWNVGITGTVAVTGTFWQAKQPTSVADGDNAALGSKADAKSIATDTTPASSIALLKGQIDRLQALLTAMGTLYQAGGALPLPAGAATDAKVEAVRALLAGTLSINLPTGAATDAKLAAILSALGTPLQTGGTVTVGNNTDPATGTKQSANTAAIAATQAAPGTLAGTAHTVTVTIPQIAATSRSGLFGTTATQLMPANASRHFIQVQVQSSSGGCYINGTTTATADQNSLLITGSSGMFESASHVGTGAISIICTAASTPVYAREG